MSDDDAKPTGKVISFSDFALKKDLPADFPVIEGEDSIEDVVRKNGIGDMESFFLNGKLHSPVWFGCLTCQLKRHRDPDPDVLFDDPPPGHSVYRIGAEGPASKYICGGCNHAVTPFMGTIDVSLSNTFTGSHKRTRALLGYCYHGSAFYNADLNLIQKWWMEHHQSVLVMTGLIPEDSTFYVTVSNNSLLDKNDS